MQITEPMTLLTDYLLAGLLLYTSLCLFRNWRLFRQQSVRLWASGFLASAAAALAGGTFHGFSAHLGLVPALLLWKVTVFAIGLAAFFLLSGALLATLSGRPRKWLLVLAGLKFLLYAAWMSGHDDFRFVIYDYAPSLVGILLLAIAALARRERYAPWLIGGVLVSFGAAGIQASGLALHRHFNHNDLYHVVQMGAFWMFYRGGALLRDR